jgi:hypothetical protein
MAVSNFLSENTLISDLALIGSTACTGDNTEYSLLEIKCRAVMIQSR